MNSPFGLPIVDVSKREGEIIFHFLKTDTNLGFGLAAEQITQTPEYYHETTRKVLVVIHGSIEIRVYKGKSSDRYTTYIVGKGQSCVVPLRRRHRITAHNCPEALVYTFGFPAYDEEDYFARKAT